MVEASPEPSTSRQDEVSSALIMDLLNGFRKSRVLLAAVELGIFDALSAAEASGKPACDVSEVITALSSRGCPKASTDGITRLLDASVSLGLLTKCGADRYGLTPVSQVYLTSSSGRSLSGYVIHSSKVVWPLFTGLEAAVIKGSHVWTEQMGCEGHEIFSHIYNTPEALLRFMHGMHAFSALSAPGVVAAFDLSQVHHMVDLGGATGALIVEAVRQYPQLTGHVVDLPHVISAAQEHFTKPPHVARPELLERVRWCAGDFFGSPDALPRGDCYVLGRILHDWEEARCAALLRVVHDLLPPGGCVLLAEMLLAEDHSGPAPALLQSLNMLVQTHGRERSLGEYIQLLEAAGFTRVEGKRTGSYLDAVIAYKSTRGRVLMA